MARPATLFGNIDPRVNLVGLLIYIVPVIILFFRHSIKLSRKFVYILLLYTIWFVIHLSIDQELKILQYVFIYLHLFVAYVIANVFRENLFGYFWRIVAYLTLIDLALWGVTNYMSPDQFEELSLLEPASTTSIASFGIFNVADPFRYDGLGLFGLMRNCGFAWEPGLYGSILVLAIYFNLAEKNYQILGNKWFYVLVLGVFSTFSTTAYSALLLLFAIRYLFLQIDNFTLKKIFKLLLGAFITYGIFTLPFMTEKIGEKADNDSFITEDTRLLQALDEYGELKTVDRIEGIYLDYANFKDLPVFGYGMNRENSFVYREISERLVTSNDITSLLARWGAIMGLLIILSLCYNSHALRKYYCHDKNSIFCVYAVIAVSYSLTTCALCMALLLFTFLIDNDGDDEYELERNSEVI